MSNECGFRAKLLDEKERDRERERETELKFNHVYFGLKWFKW